MSYTLNDRPLLCFGSCGGVTRKGEPCQRRGADILGHGFWCNWHGTIYGPNEEQRRVLERLAAASS